MDLPMTLPTPVYVIWWLTLAIVVLIFVPLAIIRLHRILLAALAIKRYLREMLAAGVGIVDNTNSITALNDTLGVAGAMVETAGDLDRHSAAIAEVLAERATKEQSR